MDVELRNVFVLFESVGVHRDSLQQLPPLFLDQIFFMPVERLEKRTQAFADVLNKERRFPEADYITVRDQTSGVEVGNLHYLITGNQLLADVQILLNWHLALQFLKQFLLIEFHAQLTLRLNSQMTNQVALQQIFARSYMEKDQKQIVHFYGFEQNQYSPQELVENLVKALNPYLNSNVSAADVKVRGKSNKLWAFIAVEESLAKELDSLQTISVGGKDIHVKRYYHDYQIFINKLPSDIKEEEVRDYMGKFGQVVDLVVTVPAEKKSAEEFNHCYVKIADEDTANRIILFHKHQIRGVDVRVVRTFKLDEDEDTDKRLILKLEGAPASGTKFEEKAIEFFRQFGTLRKRPKLEVISENRYKMIVTYTSSSAAARSLENFESSSFKAELEQENLKMVLQSFLSKDNKIFVSNLNQNVTEKDLYERFGVFGEVSDASINQNRMKPVISAIVGFTDENGYKNAMSNYPYETSLKQIFKGKPYITVYLTPEQKKSYHEMKNKSQKPILINNPMFRPQQQHFYNQPSLYMAPGRFPPHTGYPGAMIQRNPQMGGNVMPGMKQTPPPHFIKPAESSQWPPSKGPL